MNIYMEIAIWTLFASIVLAVLGVLASMFEDAPRVSVLGTIMALSGAFLAASSIRDTLATDPSVFTLTKSDWTCSRSRTEVTTTYISDGKGGLMPFVTSSGVRDAYVRVGR